MLDKPPKKNLSPNSSHNGGRKAKMENSNTFLFVNSYLNLDTNYTHNFHTLLIFTYSFYLHVFPLLENTITHIPTINFYTQGNHPVKLGL